MRHTHHFNSTKNTMKVLQRTLSVLVFLFPSKVFALDGNLALDLGTAGNSRAHADSLAAVRTMPSSLSLTPRYQIAGSAYLYPNLDYGLSGAAVDSSTGTFAIGVCTLEKHKNTVLIAHYCPVGSFQTKRSQNSLCTLLWEEALP